MHCELNELDYENDRGEGGTRCQKRAEFGKQTRVWIFGPTKQDDDT